MRRLRAWVLRCRGLIRREQRERELADEIASHLAMHIDDNLRAGMEPGQARREANLKLGGVESSKEAYRQRSTVPWLENFLQDARFGMRQLRKNSGFAFTAMLMLALGMAASVAIFAFVDAALIKPLPYRNPGQLVGLFESVRLCPKCYLSYPDYLDWKQRNKVFSAIEVYDASGFILRGREGAEQVQGARVTASFFRTLGVTPMFGRNFRASEDTVRAPRTVLLSYAAWQKRYGGKPDVLGQTVTLNGDPYTVIGVLPPGFQFAPAGTAEFWTALHATGFCDQHRYCHALLGVARLKDGVSIQSAAADVKSIARQLEKEYPDSNRGQMANLVPLTDVIVGDIRPVLLVLQSGAGLLLLIAGVNVGGLLLVRTEGRRREMAVRSALGGSTRRLFAQFVTEGCLLVAFGSVMGVLAAYGIVQLLAKLIPEDVRAGMPYLNGLGLRAPVLGFAGSVALSMAVLFSFVPRLRLSLAEMRAGLADGSRGSAGTVWRRFGSKFVALELGMAMVLLVGAGLLGQSLYRLLQVDLGFRPEQLATLTLAAPDKSYGQKEQSVVLGRKIMSRVARQPGVESVGLSSTLPLHGAYTFWIRVMGRPYNGEHNEVNKRKVSSGYFGALEATLWRGRWFGAMDDASKPPVVIINRALASKYFPGEDPIGKQIAYALSAPAEPMEIIGVINDIKEEPLDNEVFPTVYVPFEQDPTDYFSLVVRTRQANEQRILPALVAAIHGIDPGIAVFDERSMSRRINESQAAYLHRCSAWLVGGFALLALLLGVIGLYGVIAYSVSQRTREIGVRMALGAERSAVYELILREAAWLIGSGIVAGALCSIAAAASIRHLLFGVAAYDVPTLAAVGGLLGLFGLLASFLPARRAARINPLEALRSE